VYLGGKRKKMRIRRMEERDLPTVDAWVCAEGWRPARKDMEAYYAADPRGLWVLVSKSEVAGQEEEIIGIIGTMCWGSRYGHIGLFIVAEAERGKGYGKQLWSHAVKVIRISILHSSSSSCPTWEEWGYAKPAGVRVFHPGKVRTFTVSNF
jgi:GNAT superfamily N-acetyltransferase